MKPMPTLATALKWVVVDDLDLLDAGPHWPTWSGSMTNAQTFSRDALIGTVPSKCMDPPGADAGQSCIGEAALADRYVAGSLMNRVRQPIEQNA